MDTYATVDNEVMFIKADEQRFEIPTRGPWECGDGWTQHPKGFGTLVGSTYSANARGIDCWRLVEQTITAPASGKVVLEMSMAIDQGVNNEAWGFHSMQFEPVQCPSPPTPAQEPVSLTEGYKNPGVSQTALANGQIAFTTGGWSKASAFGKWINADDVIRGVEFKCPDPTSHILAGITNADIVAGNSYHQLDFGICIRGGWGGARTPDVYENGVHRHVGNQASGYENDIFSVVVNAAGKVEYAQNGAIFYTSAKAVQYPWRIVIDTYVATNPQVSDLEYVQ